MKYMFIFACLGCCLFFSSKILAQEGSEKEKPKHQLTLILSHAHITEGVNESGVNEWVAVPSWGFDYNYWLAEHWAIGLHTDIIIENFAVEGRGDHEETIERTKPFAAVPVAVFKPKEHSSFIVGMGAEFAKEGNFALTRFGYEYGWELPKHWELSAGLMYDIKWNAYDTWVIGVGISKFF